MSAIDRMCDVPFRVGALIQPMLATFPLFLLLTIFAVCVALIWFAGVKLAHTTDTLASEIFLAIRTKPGIKTIGAGSAQISHAGACLSDQEPLAPPEVDLIIDFEKAAISGST